MIEHRIQDHQQFPHAGLQGEQQILIPLPAVNHQRPVATLVGLFRLRVTDLPPIVVPHPLLV